MNEMFLTPVEFAEVCLTAISKTTNLQEKVHPATISAEFAAMAHGIGAAYARAIADAHNAQHTHEHDHEENEDEHEHDGRS